MLGHRPAQLADLPSLWHFVLLPVNVNQSVTDSSEKKTAADGSGDCFHMLPPHATNSLTVKHQSHTAKQRAAQLKKHIYIPAP